MYIRYTDTSRMNLHFRVSKNNKASCVAVTNFFERLSNANVYVFASSNVKLFMCIAAVAAATEEEENAVSFWDEYD